MQDLPTVSFKEKKQYQKNWQEPKKPDCYVLMEGKHHAIDLYKLMAKELVIAIVGRLDDARRLLEPDLILLADLQGYAGDPVKLLKHELDDVDLKLALPAVDGRRESKESFKEHRVFVQDVERYIKKVKKMHRYLPIE